MRPSHSGPPVPHRRCALFLDFDGTLVDLVASPDAVRPAPELVPLLERLVQVLDGAVAVITGRQVATIDRFLAPLRLPIAGVHGLEMRRHAGRRTETAAIGPELNLARGRIETFARSWPGVRVEDKGIGIAVHWREAPAAAEEVRAMTTEIHDESGDRLALIEGKMVAELVPAGRDKGWAIGMLLADPPFADRLPVFLGDDVTDEAGFDVVNARGGVSIRVGGGRQRTAARHRLADPAAVAAWLAALADEAQMTAGAG